MQAYEKLETLGYNIIAIYGWNGKTALLVQKGSEMFAMFFKVREFSGRRYALSAGLSALGDDTLPEGDLLEADEVRRLVPVDVFHYFAESIVEWPNDVLGLPDLHEQRRLERRAQAAKGCGWYNAADLADEHFASEH